MSLIVFFFFDYMHIFTIQVGSFYIDHILCTKCIFHIESEPQNKVHLGIVDYELPDSQEYYF